VMSDDDEKVIAVEFDLPDPRIIRKGRTCYHSHFEVDERALKVFCRDCGVEVDPMRALLDLSLHTANYMHSIKKIKAERERIGNELGELKRKRTNLKAQVKRLEAKMKSGGSNETGSNLSVPKVRRRSR
jgi:hypothetical protein